MKLAINDFLKGNQETAIAKFEKLIQKEPENADVLYNYGCILGELEHYEKEQNLYKRILEKNPNDSDRKSCNWYLTANALVFKDDFLVLR